MFSKKGIVHTSKKENRKKLRTEALEKLSRRSSPGAAREAIPGRTPSPSPRLLPSLLPDKADGKPRVTLEDGGGEDFCRWSASARRLGRGGARRARSGGPRSAQRPFRWRAALVWRSCSGRCGGSRRCWWWPDIGRRAWIRALPAGSGMARPDPSCGGQVRVACGMGALLRGSLCGWSAAGGAWLPLVGAACCGLGRRPWPLRRSGMVAARARRRVVVLQERGREEAAV